MILCVIFHGVSFAIRIFYTMLINHKQSMKVNPIKIVNIDRSVQLHACKKPFYCDTFDTETNKELQQQQQRTITI